MRKADIVSKLDEIIDWSGVSAFVDTPVKRYSSGMRVRLAFAVAAHLEPEILIVDEVLAVGDTEFQSKCLGKMNEVARSGALGGPPRHRERTPHASSKNPWLLPSEASS
jgi:lipopolysaccharide transport system ATP-binding protein